MSQKSQMIDLNITISTDKDVDPVYVAEWFERFLNELAAGDELLEGHKEGFEEATGATFLEIDDVSVG